MGIFDKVFKKQEEEEDIEEIEVPEPPKEEKTYVKPLKSQKSFTDKTDTIKVNNYKEILNADSLPQAKNEPTIRKKYDELLEGKIKDKTIKEDLIKHSDLLLRKRITMLITLEGTNISNKGQFEVVGMLPEDEIEIKNFFVDETIHYNEWGAWLEKFKEYMQSTGKTVIAVNNKLAITEDLHVNQVNISATFI